MEVGGGGGTFFKREGGMNFAEEIFEAACFFRVMD